MAVYGESGLAQNTLLAPGIPCAGNEGWNIDALLIDQRSEIVMLHVKCMHVVQDLNDTFRYALNVVGAAHRATQFFDMGDHHSRGQREDLVAVTTDEFGFRHGRIIAVLC
jgi:hypothetical protein